MSVDGGLAFFDTNILVYTDDSSAPAKQRLATALVSGHGNAGTLVISLQVLQEYFAAATRKLKVDPADAQRKVEILARSKVVRFTERDVIAAIELHRITNISFWDAMIVHAARSVNAAVLYTEDLAHGVPIAGIPVRNPFLGISRLG